MRVGALLQNWQEYCKKIIFKTNKPKKYNETQQNSTGIKLQGGKHTHTHTHTYKKRIKQILSTQDPIKIGFWMKERKKKVNLNPLYDIIHKHLFETIIGKLKHNSCRIKLLNKAKENM